MSSKTGVSSKKVFNFELIFEVFEFTRENELATASPCLRYPLDEPVIISFKSTNDAITPLEYSLRPYEGRLYWESEELPVGEYIITYETVNGVQTSSDSLIIIEKNNSRFRFLVNANLI